MEAVLELPCPFCQALLPADAYFCPHCGKAVKALPLSTSIAKQIYLYFVGIFLPPIGFWYGWKYLKERSPLAKRIGWVVILLTAASLIVTIWITKSAIDTFNQSLSGYQNLNF